MQVEWREAVLGTGSACAGLDNDDDEHWGNRMRRSALHVSLAAALGRRVGQYTRPVGFALAVGVSVLAAAPLAVAQEAPQQQVDTHEFNIPSGALSSALLRFGQQAGLQFNIGSNLTDGKRTAGINGKYSTEAALRALLAGSGLTFRFAGPRTVVIEAAPDAGDARVLGPLRIEGNDRGAAVNGVNGSTDVTATEGTGSYTSGALSIASKTPLSIRETPQAVSVITQQRMQDQNLIDLTSVMNQATGITLVQDGNSLKTLFYSRGFVLNNIQIDGGTPLNLGQVGWRGGYSPLIDMAQYDHVEILRGTDGLFNGFGDPGGSVNLTRKRPLDRTQVVVEGQAGSWNNYRTVLDATAPLGFSGKLRGRAVMSYQDQDYFYDMASSNHTLAYGMVEADATPTTVVSGGFSITRMNTLPDFHGLPRYDTGADLHLPRSTSYALPWNRWNFETTELFAQVEQRLGQDWSAKVNLTRVTQTSSQKISSIAGPVVMGDDSPFITISGHMNDYRPKQTLADFTINGTFELFGHSQNLVVGANWQELDASGEAVHEPLYDSFVSSIPPPRVDPFNFDPFDYAYSEPGSSLVSQLREVDVRRQRGAYAMLRLTLWEPLHLIAGIRYGKLEYNSLVHMMCGPMWDSFGLCELGSLWYSDETSFDEEKFSIPALALTYDINSKLSAHVSYTNLYREQSQSLDINGNPLEPMTGSNIEVGLKFEGFAGKFNGALSAYRIEKKNEAVPVNIAPIVGGCGYVYFCYEQGNRVDLSQGVDAEITGELLPGWQLYAGYTFNKNEIEGSDYYGEDYTGPKIPRTSRVPKHLLKLWTSYQFQTGEVLRRINIGGGVNAQTENYNRGSVCSAYTFFEGFGNFCTAYTPYEFTQGGYALFSARIAYQVNAQWNVALNINNIGDRTYYQTPGTSEHGNWYGQPRNYMLTLRGKF